MKKSRVMARCKRSYDSGLLLAFILITLIFVLPDKVLAVTDTYSTSGTFSWVVPVGVTSVTVEAWGGGGSGGGTNGRRLGGGGGAGGQYSRRLLNVIPGNSYAVVVGAGGSGSVGDGATGEDSTFGGNAVVAKGGAGGSRAQGYDSGGAAGMASTSGGIGDIVYSGGNGSAGNSYSSGAGGGGAGSGGPGGDASGTVAGSGAASGGGAGGVGRTTSGNGSDGSTAGGGGGGSYIGYYSERHGGDGATGRVSITYELPPAVTSMSLADFNPTMANTSVAWSVEFSGSVTGVDASDFVLVESGGTTGSGITSVTGSGLTWTVTADTGTAMAGTLGLNLVDNDTIVNGLGTPLGGTGMGNGDYTGPYYTLEPPAPVLAKTASTSAATVGDVVTFAISATNPYSDPINSITMTDSLPVGMSYVTHVATLGSVSISGQTVTWNIPSLPTGATAQVTLAVTLTQ